MKKGISLIILIITILVIIILATVVITSINASNPINKAGETAFKNDAETYNSELKLFILNSHNKNRLYNESALYASIWDGSSDIIDTVKAYIPSLKFEDGSKYAIVKGELVFIGEDPVQKEWAANLGISTDTSSVVIPTDFPVATIDVITTENSTINGEVPTATNPVIPGGFKPIEDGTTWTDTVASVDEGLVIQDIIGNQFVWVPVDGTNVTYSKWTSVNIAYNNANISDDTLPAGVTSEMDQITKYGGFYVARYETGETTLSIRNIPVWLSLNYNTAKTRAEAMINTPTVKSGLITGTQWDTMMKWVQNDGYNVTTDSRNWGNYFTSQPPANVPGAGSTQRSGYSEFWKSRNIYDLAGNAWEWTSEKYGTQRIIRGGHFNLTGTSDPAAYRNRQNTTYSWFLLGFRVALFVL